MFRGSRRRVLATYLLIVSVLWMVLLPVVYYVDSRVNRPVCADAPQAELTARVEASWVVGDKFYVYLAHDAEPGISTRPLNLTGYYLVTLDEGGVVDVCITFQNYTSTVQRSP